MNVVDCLVIALRNIDIIRNKLVDLGLVTEHCNLDEIAAAIEDIDSINSDAPIVGAITGEIDGFETTEYVIPAGYHNGLGKVRLTDDIERALAEL